MDLKNAEIPLLKESLETMIKTILYREIEESYPNWEKTLDAESRSMISGQASLLTSKTLRFLAPRIELARLQISERLEKRAERLKLRAASVTARQNRVYNSFVRTNKAASEKRATEKPNPRLSTTRRARIDD